MTRRILAGAMTAAMLAGCAVPGGQERPAPGAPAEFHVPPEAVPPLGQCRIWYTELPPQWQPPPMPCARAHRLAQEHGGRVIKAVSPASFGNGRTLAVDYGPSNFDGIPPEQLPPPGYCRPWYERVAAERQPAPMTCERAAKLVQLHGGRILYMPGPAQP